MYCPKCEWNVVSFAVETRRWSCKRCKYEWTEKSRPSTTALFGQRTMKRSGPASPRSKGRKSKPPASKAKKKISRGRTAGAKRRR